jgi:predicted lipid-binding transport protein (Tim44 family)
MTATADSGASWLGALARALGVGLLIAGAALALMFAFAAALVIGFVVAGAALAMRFAPSRRKGARAEVLEARRTPDGWVVETLKP